MNLKKRFLAIVLGLVILAGCTGKGSGDKDAYLNAVLGAEPTTLDAQKGDDVYGNGIINNVYEPLVRLREDGDKLEIEPAGAESYEVSEDRLVYTFKLRDFNWEDGQPVTATDYEYGIKRAADPNTGSSMAFLLAPIKNFEGVNSGEKPLDELGVKALDEKTLEVTLEKPAEYFIRMVTQRVMMPQRQDLVEQHGESFGSEASSILGCGPFKIDSWVHNSEIKLVKSETYWDQEKVGLQAVNYRIITDANTSMQAFETGEVDVIGTTLKEWTEKFDQKDGVTKREVPLPSTDYMILNTKDEILSNQKVRQAFQIALDREGLNAQVHQGAIIPATGWVPPSITLNGEVFVHEGEGPIVALKNAHPDPKALLEEGLKELGKETDPSKLTFEFQMVNNPVLKSTGEFIQANLKETLGINVELNLMEWPILNTNIAKGNYQIGYLAWTADYDDPYAMLSLFTKEAAAVNTGWTSEEYDTLVKEAASEPDTQQAAEKYLKAQEMLIDNAPILPLINVKTNQYFYNYVKDLNGNNFATTGWKYVKIEGR